MGGTVTLRELTGMSDVPASLGDSVVVMVDAQNTYTRGVMELEGVEAALDAAEELLDRARSLGTPVVHIQHDAGAGSPYDVGAEIGRIVDRVAPRGDEPVVVKNFPNAFVGTDLEDRLRRTGKESIVVAGFMTHMCVNSTARGAFSLGFAPTVVASATATRRLPGGGGVEAPALQAASLAAIADLFGVVAPDVAALPD
ncbi:cysteine hydrolase family protein [Nocardioides zeae]|uniref:Cysteine hydrolase family protein n=1 Tax=Nocardioides imazamoxiresistens TaxID=3231893 RepID=A0ABU3PTT1_9ACTN|nr:cysteine hydrolase family protein [Nocardioides zeae]MDT9592644.1 cysteine hydrolase family protein [Nocardioides zeae]